VVVVEMFLHGGLHSLSPLPQAPAFARPPSLYWHRGLWGDTGNWSHKNNRQKGRYF